MIAAYAAGYDVWGELARRDADPHHLKGLHPTGVFGGIAAAAACANLLGLDAGRATHAIGIAASQAAGLVANFGSMTKPFHAGRAAQAGVLSARLAAQGMTAAPDVIEALPAQPIDPPTLAMSFRINDGPLAGKEGDKVQSRVIRERLERETERNVAIKVRMLPDETDAFEVAGRGELQLAILIEVMRREGFEVTVGRPDASPRSGPARHAASAAAKSSSSSAAGRRGGTIPRWSRSHMIRFWAAHPISDR